MLQLVSHSHLRRHSSLPISCGNIRDLQVVGPRRYIRVDQEPKDIFPKVVLSCESVLCWSVQG